MEFPDEAVKAALALAVLAAGYYVSGLLVRFLGRPIAWRFRRPSVTRTVLRGVRVLAPLSGASSTACSSSRTGPTRSATSSSSSTGTAGGFVEDITLRYTKVFTLENTFLVIPNATTRERDIINYSAEDERTRLSLTLLVTYESDVGAAREVMEEAARTSGSGALATPWLRPVTSTSTPTTASS